MARGGAAQPPASGVMSPDGKKKLDVGSRVEVLQADKGLRGAWFAGEVVEAKPLRRSVRYEELLAEDGGSARLVETIKVAPALDGTPVTETRAVSRSQRSRQHFLSRVRPTPPAALITPSSLRPGDCVDVRVDDAWWEAIFVQPGRHEGKGLLFFPDELDRQERPYADMRPGQDWDDKTGTWHPRTAPEEWQSAMAKLEPIEAAEESAPQSAGHSTDRQPADMTAIGNAEDKFLIERLVGEGWRVEQSTRKRKRPELFFIEPHGTELTSIQQVRAHIKKQDKDGNLDSSAGEDEHAANAKAAARKAAAAAVVANQTPKKRGRPPKKKPEDAAKPVTTAAAPATEPQPAAPPAAAPMEGFTEQVLAAMEPSSIAAALTPIAPILGQPEMDTSVTMEQTFIGGNTQSVSVTTVNSATVVTDLPTVI